MKKYILFPVILLMLIVPLAARETGKLTGSVIDGQTGEGLIGANVYL